MRTKTQAFIMASTITTFLTLVGVGLVAANMYKTIIMDTINGENVSIKAEFLLSPKKIACLTYDSVDILDKLGMGDRIVGMVKGAVTPAHLQKYNDNPQIVDLGRMKEPNMQALAELKPDVILAGGRNIKMYDALARIAPTLVTPVQTHDGFIQGVKKVAIQHGILLEKEKEIAKFLSNIDSQIARIKQKAQGRKAIQAIFVQDTLHILGAQATGGKGGGKVLIADLGFDNVGSQYDKNNKDISAYDYILQQNPEFIFVLDKNIAIGTQNPTAKEVLPKNEKIMQTQAFKSGKLIFVSPENTWYVNNGGLSAVEEMLTTFRALPKAPSPEELKAQAAAQQQASSQTKSETPTK